ERAQGAAGAVEEAHAEPRRALHRVQPHDLAFEKKWIPKMRRLDGEREGGTVRNGFEHFHARPAQAQIDESRGPLPTAVAATDDRGQPYGPPRESAKMVQWARGAH